MKGTGKKMNKTFYSEAIVELIDAGVVVSENVALCNYTTFKIGGNTPLMVSPASSEEVSRTVEIFNKYNISYFVLGNGSNLLVRDSGLDKAVIFTGNLKNISISENKIIADSGCLLSKVAAEAAKISLCGMEALHGIPGSVGGAVRMNAGAYGSEMSQVVEYTEFVDKFGAIRRVYGEEHLFGYRKSCFSDDDIVTSVCFSLQKGNSVEIYEKMNDFAKRRRESQPLEYPSAGSVFKRPEGYFAGKLIQDSGLKGRTVGGAQVSEKHAGFIINVGGATCSDVIELVELIQDTVFENYGVKLETEIKIV